VPNLEKNAKIRKKQTF